MSNPVKISVIVPVYNVEQYLPICLESCISQTLYDIEIICVNDGSTDTSADILRQYAALDNRILVINKENGGLSSARNVGIEAANGKIIMFLDSDDYLSPNACERVWVEFEEAYTEIVVFGTEILPTNPAPSEWHNRTLHIGTRRYSEFSPHILFHEPGSKPFVWRQAFLSDFLKRTQVVFDESVGYGEDIVFQFEIFPEATYISYISDRLYNYRWYRKGSLMEGVNRSLEKKIEQHLCIIDKIFDKWQDRQIFNKYGSYPLAWALEFIVYDLRDNDYEKKEEYAETLQEIIKKYDLVKYEKELSLDMKKLYKVLRSI